MVAVEVISPILDIKKEQNEMLGYHRESAPNPEREQAIKQRTEKERERLRELVRIRINEIAMGTDDTDGGRQ